VAVDPDQPFIVYRQSDGSWFAFDNCIEEQHVPTATATVHPIEDGAAVTDHVQRQQDRIAVRALVTESPRSITGDEITGPERIRAAIAFLESCFGEPLALGLTRTSTINDALLIAAPYTIDGQRRVVFDLTFQVATFAEATSVKIPAAKPVAPVAVGAADELDAGQQACTAAFTDADSDARAPSSPQIRQDQSNAYDIAHAANPVRFP
jgi:hypothetical protein